MRTLQPDQLSPQGASGQQLVVKGLGLKSPWAPKVPDHILVSLTEKAILRAPSPPAVTPFWWFFTPQHCSNGRLDPGTWAH